MVAAEMWARWPGKIYVTKWKSRYKPLLLPQTTTATKSSPNLADPRVEVAMARVEVVLVLFEVGLAHVQCGPETIELQKNSSPQTVQFPKPRRRWNCRRSEWMMVPVFLFVVFRCAFAISLGERSKEKSKPTMKHNRKQKAFLSSEICRLPGAQWPRPPV